jgi:hypothetical protein
MRPLKMPLCSSGCGPWGVRKRSMAATAKAMQRLGRRSPITSTLAMLGARRMPFWAGRGKG